LGCGTGVNNKRIPDFLWKASRSCKLAFVEGYMNGDGHRRSLNGTSQEHATSVSRELIAGLHYLLLSCGIQSNLSFQSYVTPKSKVERIAYKLDLFSQDDQRWAHSNCVPKEFVSDYNQKRSWTLAKIAEKELQINQNLCEDIALLRVKKIDKADYSGTVYDLSVTGIENFIGGYGSICLHNTIEGGMIWCKNPEHAARARRLINLGLSDDSGFTSNRLNWWEFEVSDAAGRADMTDVQAAIGLVQLDKLPQFIGMRARIEYIYSQKLGHLDRLSTPPEVSIDNRSSHYFYWIQVEKRDELARFLRKNGVYTTMRYYPLHKVKFFNSHGDLPNAEQAAAETLLLPLHQGLSDEDVKKVARLVKRWAHKS